MFVALVIVSALLALAAAASGYNKVRPGSEMPQQMNAHLGVPERLVPVLGYLLIAGAVGTLAGIWWAPIGIAATGCFVLYFLGAVTTHLRVKDWAGLVPTGVLTLVSAAAFALHLLVL